MRRSLLLSLVIYAIIFSGLIGLRGEIVLLALPFVLYLIIGLMRAPEILKLEITRALSAEYVSPLTQIEVTLNVTNHGDSIEELYLRDIVPAGLMVRLGSPSRLVTLSRGQTLTWTYTVSGPRGGYFFNKVYARAQDHFGVTSLEVQLEARAKLLVFPTVTPVRNISIRPRRTRSIAGLIPSRVGGTGTEFYGLRNYQQGDPPRWINWQASARHNELYTNEFQQERASDVGIVLDGRLLSNQFKDSHSLFEYSIQAAASLSDAFLANGNRVGLLVYSSYMYWTLPRYGKFQRERIMHALAEARAGGGLVFSGLDHLPTRLFPPQSQIVVISPVRDEDLRVLFQLRAHGYQVLLISPDSVSFELSLLPKTAQTDIAARILRMERTLLLNKLSQAGVQTLEWNVTLPFDQLMRRGIRTPTPWMRGLRV